MSKEEMKRIFSRFYQIDKSHFSEGNGLGLAIVKRIIELNVGTLMTVNLPIEEETNKILIK